MKAIDSASNSGIQLASLRSQQSRKPSVPFEHTSTGNSSATARERALENTSAGGKGIPDAGKTLPSFSAPHQFTQGTDHTTGLANAIEQLQKNSEKNSQAMGLLRALETLMERQNPLRSVDTEA